MKQLIFLFVALNIMLLSACSNHIPSHQYLVNTLNVGVLKNNAHARHMANKAFPSQTYGQLSHPYQITYLSHEELLSGLQRGNLDVVIGMPYHTSGETGKSLSPDLTSLRVTDTKLNETGMAHYFVASKNTALSQQLRLNKFMQQAKAIGYPTNGNNARLYEWLLAQHPYRYVFTPCDNLRHCAEQVQNQQLDALITLDPQHLLTLSSINEAQQQAMPGSLALTPARIKETLHYSLWINQRSLTEDEQSQLQERLEYAWNLPGE